VKAAFGAKTWNAIILAKPLRTMCNEKVNKNKVQKTVTMCNEKENKDKVQKTVRKAQRDIFREGQGRKIEPRQNLPRHQP
jgi:FKBP-type peptidyl-prolyl cis-trans isomerase